MWEKALVTLTVNSVVVVAFDITCGFTGFLQASSARYSSQ